MADSPTPPPKDDAQGPKRPAAPPWKNPAQEQDPADSPTGGTPGMRGQARAGAKGFKDGAKEELGLGPKKGSAKKNPPIARPGGGAAAKGPAPAKPGPPSAKGLGGGIGAKGIGGSGGKTPGGMGPGGSVDPQDIANIAKGTGQKGGRAAAAGQTAAKVGAAALDKSLAGGLTAFKYGMLTARKVLPIVLSLALFFILGIAVLSGISINNKSTQTAGAACPSSGTQATEASASGANVDPVKLQRFLLTLRTHESGGDYKAYNAAGGASGAYQYIQSTWTSYASQSGNAQYASGPASDAPPAIQDAVAAYDASAKYASYAHFGGNVWKWVAEAWYYPLWAGDPAHQNSVPYPSAGNTLTIGEFGDWIVSHMDDPNFPADYQNGASATTTTVATEASCASTGGALGARIVAIAQKEVGKTLAQGHYNESNPPGDWCAYFATWVWQQAGVKIPSLAYSGAPYQWVKANGGKQLPPTATPQPGDLAFFGAGPNPGQSEHVAIVSQVTTQNGVTEIATINGNYGGPYNTSTVVTSPPQPVPLTQATANAEDAPGPLYGYAQPPGM